MPPSISFPLQISRALPTLSRTPAIINCYVLHTSIMLLPTTEDDILGCSSLVRNYRISNTSALAHCPRSQNVGHNKFQLVYTYFYKHLKIITLTFSLCSAHSRAQTPVPVRVPVQVHVHVQGLPSSVSVYGA